MNDMTWHDMAEAMVFGGEIYISLYVVIIFTMPLNVSNISYNLNMICISYHMPVVLV
jgi:hypothetical protein